MVIVYVIFFSQNENKCFDIRWPLVNFKNLGIRNNLLWGQKYFVLHIRVSVSLHSVRNGLFYHLRPSATYNDLENQLRIIYVNVNISALGEKSGSRKLFVNPFSSNSHSCNFRPSNNSRLFIFFFFFIRNPKRNTKVFNFYQNNYQL